MARASKRAVITAETVAVCCPDCGAEYPSTASGDDAWTIEELRAAENAVLVCVSCDEQFTVNVDHKVNLP